MSRASTTESWASAPWFIGRAKCTVIDVDFVWLSLRARLRRAWLPSLFIALLIGVVGGFVLAAAAAARRVDFAYEALISEIDAPDLLVIPRCGSNAITGCTADTVGDGRRCCDRDADRGYRSRNGTPSWVGAAVSARR